MRANRDYLVGMRFGRLMVLERNQARKDHFFCVCDCGRTKSINSQSLIRRLSQSCGCLRREQMSARVLKHGASKAKLPEYGIWKNLWQRCAAKRGGSYLVYAAQGIEVSERWRNFAAFLADVGHRPSLHMVLVRLDKNRGYEPGNCRWAARKEMTRTAQTFIPNFLPLHPQREEVRKS